MTLFNCECGNALFFENTVCLQCGSAVGYDAGHNQMRPVTEPLVRCRNGIEFGACNWLLPAGGPEYCISCRLNRTVPNLGVNGNLAVWRKMETAKRRVICTLARLGIAPRSKLEVPGGVAFDILAPVPEHRVITGHENGIITVNLFEADDYYREHERHLLGEPFRTLVGHFRHEMGHYYWERFFRGRHSTDTYLAGLRSLFGDEREDYAQALARHYATGPAATWPVTHITGYATAHAWEDWAETWAHYLHIVDGVETAQAFGLLGANMALPFTQFSPAELLNDTDADDDFLATLNAWAKLSPALNEIAASLGHPNLYPFVFSPAAMRKIFFVHKMVLLAAATWDGPTPAPPPLAQSTASASA